MPEQGIVIRVDLGIQRQQVSVHVDNQGVDLDQAQVFFPEQAVQPGHDLTQLPDLQSVQTHAKTYLA